ncbi:MAG TPA: hypothetical protein PLZ95_14665 [Bryobacteraceae bacterium]|nr:hypothetical protein [Bryobacteraceae bacterium]
MPADNKLELVVEVDVNRANASIKSVNAGLSSMEATAVRAARGASSGIDGLTVSVAKGAAAAGVLASAFERVVGWVKTQVEETSRLAARNETLAVVNAQLARANGYNEGSIERLVTRIKDLGITTQASRDIVNKMIAAQLDLSKATDLARLAQDAAVVAGQDSSAALQGIMSGITTQQIEVLRTYGINIQFERAFTEARRRLGRDMTEIERRNTALNVVLAEGPKIAGAYEASLGTVGKQMGSLSRYVEEAKAAIGAEFLPEMRRMIEGLTDLAKWVNRNSDALGLFAKAIAAAAIGAAVAQFIGWIAGAKRAVDALTLAMTRNPFTAIAVGAAVAGTAIYEMNQRTLEANEEFVAMQRAADDLKRINEAINAGKSIEDLKKMGYTLEQVRAAMFGGKQGAKAFFDAFDNDQFRQRMRDLNQAGVDAEEARRRKAEAEALAKDIAKHQIQAERESAQAVTDARRANLTGFAREMAQMGDQTKKWDTFTDDKGVEHQAGLTRRAWQNVIEELSVRWAAFREKFQRDTRAQLAEHVDADREAAQRRLAIEASVVQKRLEFNEEIARRNLDHLDRTMGIEEQRATLARDARLRSLEAVDAQTLEQKAAVEAQRAQIEIDHIERVHGIRMRMFELETSTLLIEEEAAMVRLGYRADEIRARIAELTAQRDEIKRANQNETSAAIDAARQNAANRTAEMIRDHNRGIFDTFKRQAEGVFDALLSKSQSIWSAIGNSLKTALLTAIKDVVTSRVAAMLMQMFTGTSVSMRQAASGSTGILGSLGGLVGIGASPVFAAAGGGSLPASVSMLNPVSRMGSAGLAGGMSGATIGGLSAAGLGSMVAGGGALGVLGAFRAGQSSNNILKYSSPAIGAVAGMTTMGGLMAMFPALVAAGPWGMIAAAGIGAAIGLMGMFRKTAEQKAIDKIRDIYKVTVDKSFARSVIEMAKSSFGGNLEAAIRSAQVRDMVIEYGIATGQNAGMLDNKPRGVWMTQQGGTLYQSGFAMNGQQYGYSASLPSLGNLRTPQQQPQQVVYVTIQADGESTERFLEGKTVKFVKNNEGAVTTSFNSGMSKSLGRAAAATAINDPLAVKI